ncbi:MAG TPA: YkgJ family cysteine cluster protein [Bryobacteraceae bacterium]|nr:YkgJ family cysteine cluster protein [Bryobacteraceae bacterium]
MTRVESGDRVLIQIVDSSLAEAARRSGDWLVCRPGCIQCCIGPFAISQLDAWRLRRGLAELEQHDPGRAARVRQRARESVERIGPDFPGDFRTGLLAEGDEAEERFADFANDEPCPALDPAAGTCDLYDARPMTCRVFGPPLRCGDGEVGVCELCYQGASDEEIAACEVEVDTRGREDELIRSVEKASGISGRTIVAFVLAENDESAECDGTRGG